MREMLPSGTYYPADREQPCGLRPWCTTCGTDQYLLAESVTVLDQLSGSLAVAVTCSSRRGSRVLATTPECLAPVLSRSTPSDEAVVHLGRDYIHCGEPMAPMDPVRRQLQRPVSTQPGPGDFLGAYLQTRVLRCRCRFQMEPPH
ncbi:hypothetical protein [Arthrobacter sp. NPDC057013]|uniref:hypothetical protein n=1 Tax=Arthrobacter sp. NPDC057013 TaxID=3345999 RepID=UPI003643C112